MNNTKQKKKKYIYIIIGLALLSLVVGGVIFFWNKSKDKPNSDEEDDANDDNLTVDIKEWKKRDWIDPESGYSTYEIPPLPANISTEQAKEEVIEAIWRWGGRKWTKQKLEITLEKNSQRINLADQKEDENDPLSSAKFLENLAEKYQQKIFFYSPDQDKFDESIREIQLDFFFLLHSFGLEYKGNKEIDWQASLRKFTAEQKKRNKRKTKAQKEEDYKKMADHIEREINPFIAEHGKKFAALADLKELDQWTNVLARKMEAAERLICSRWRLAKEIGKKIPPPGKTRTISTNDPRLKNEKFGLQPILTIYKVRDE